MPANDKKMNSVSKAIQLKKELDKLRPLKKEDEERILQKFRLDWNYHSNHIEGNKLTYGETKALILHGITAQGKPLKDHIEVQGHNEAVKWILDIIKKDVPLTEKFIRELHELVLKNPYEKNAITAEGQPTKKKIVVGKYKTTPNHVRTKTGELFRFATPEETPALMHDLITWYRGKINDDEAKAILVASEFHHKFVKIHPFDDGNGRTARILMNFILMQFGYPPVVLKTEDKENYFSALRQADAGIIEPFIEYIAKNEIDALEIMIRGAKGENIEESDDIDKELHLLDNQLNSIGKKIKTFKSEDAILELYDTSLSMLITSFINKAEMLEKHYVSTDFNLFINNRSMVSGKKDTLSQNRIRINNTTRAIKPSFKYNAFNQSDFEEFNHLSEIEIQFEMTRYKVFDSQKFEVVEKLYSEPLTKEEITRIVGAEIRHHTKMITEKVDKKNRNKT